MQVDYLTESEVNIVLGFQTSNLPGAEVYTTPVAVDGLPWIATRTRWVPPTPVRG